MKSIFLNSKTVPLDSREQKLTVVMMANTYVMYNMIYNVDSPCAFVLDNNGSENQCSSPPSSPFQSEEDTEPGLVITLGELSTAGKEMEYLQFAWLCH